MPDSQSGAVAAISRRTTIQVGLALVVVNGLDVGRSAAVERREETWRDRRTPDAAARQLSFAFRQNAEGFYCGAVASHERFPDISLHSLAIAIELSLKAYLLHRGVSDDWNRVHIGHDLGRALACAKRIGLRSVPSGLSDLASALTPYYQRHAFGCHGVEPLPPRLLPRACDTVGGLLRDQETAADDRARRLRLGGSHA